MVELTAGNVDAGVRELDRTRMKWRETEREREAGFSSTDASTSNC